MLETTTNQPSNNHISLPPTIIKKTSYWPLIFKVALSGIIFWLAQFLLQYFWLSKSMLPVSFTRSFGFAGATLIGCALSLSAIFKWFPGMGMHWRVRRYLGVSGVVLIFFHIFTVTKYYFAFNYSAIYFSFNPLENPIVFGTFAFTILFIMAATSSDWAVDLLTPKRWKFIHRFVYLAYLSAIFHFLNMAERQLFTFPGYLLLVITAFAVFGQVFWFFKTAARSRFRSIGTAVGFTLISLAIVVGLLIDA